VILTSSRVAEFHRDEAAVDGTRLSYRLLGLVHAKKCHPEGAAAPDSRRRRSLAATEGPVTSAAKWSAVSRPRRSILQAPPGFSATSGVEQRRLQDDIPVAQPILTGGIHSWEPLSQRCDMAATITIKLVDGEFRFVFPDEMVKRLQLAAGDTFLVEPHENGVKLIPTGELLERYREIYRRGAEKYRNALREMADHE
jgi:hypothetical protein